MKIVHWDAFVAYPNDCVINNLSFSVFSFPGPQSTIQMTFASTLTGTTISSTSLWRFSDARQLRAPKDRPPPPSGALTENVSDALPFLSCS